MTKSPAVKPESADNLPFGAVFTDHMLEIDWTAENGWGTPEIKPFQNLSLVSINSLFLNSAKFIVASCGELPPLCDRVIRRDEGIQATRRQSCYVQT